MAVSDSEGNGYSGPWGAVAETTITALVERACARNPTASALSKPRRVLEFHRSDPRGRSSHPRCASDRRGIVGRCRCRRSRRIASACDLWLETKSVRIGFPDADAGMSVTEGASVLVTRIIDEGWARHSVLDGSLIDGDEAFRLGFITTLCEDHESLQNQTSFLVQRLNGRSRVALGPRALQKGFCGIYPSAARSGPDA